MTDHPDREFAEHQLFHDWNLIGEADVEAPANVEIDDETLRDGLQSPSVRQPSLGEKIEIIHEIAALGIGFADIGYPGAGNQMLEDVVGVAREIDREGLAIEANCAGRTHPSDILPIAEAQQRAGFPIEASVFIGSSPIRQYVEGWDIEWLLETTVNAVRLARDNDLTVMFVTEDTTRAHPTVLGQLYTAAIEAGARRICLSDTVGHASPWGVRRLVRFARETVAATGEDVKVDYHGHRDRHLSVINSITALSEGADRVHGCAIGIGERVGNTPMEPLLVNLRLLGWIDNDLTSLPRYAAAASRATDTSIPANSPTIGKDAFETSTGVHAAAVLKAMRAGDAWLANRIYSGVPAEMLGREQEITVGPMSGLANVVAWLQKHEIECTEEMTENILGVAKKGDHVLTDSEILALLGEPA
ncbi:MAG: LeuA family protein [Acidimicrobiia bacterium]